ncbi:Hypothetical predicted protein, partial [Marmota monax]
VNQSFWALGIDSTSGKVMFKLSPKEAKVLTGEKGSGRTSWCKGDRSLRRTSRRVSD